MEKLIVEKFLKNKGKKETFIKLIVKMFDDNNINKEKRMKILKEIYK